MLCYGVCGVREIIELLEGCRQILVMFDPLSLKCSFFQWLKTSYHVLLSARLSQKFFKEKYFLEQTIWIENLTNKKGIVAEISLLHGNGILNELFIPVGEERKGWTSFFNLQPH